MRQRFLYVIGAAVLAVFTASVAQAAGNLASKPTELTLAVDTIKLAFSQTKFDLETGKYYKLTITSDGHEDLSLRAPDLWQNSWVNYIEINDADLTVMGAFYIGFDSENEAAVFFVPLRPGNYQLYADGFQNRGLSATFVVR